MGVDVCDCEGGGDVGSLRGVSRGGGGDGFDGEDRGEEFGGEVLFGCGLQDRCVCF